MLTADVESFLAQGLSLMGISLDNQPAVISRLARYFKELKKWNEKVNLVARSQDDKQILENHFLDSLTILSLLPPERQKLETVLDIGTGAGFPGLVLKAACPALAVTLVEPRKNRVYFLKHIARILDLQGLVVLDARLEEKKRINELLNRHFSFVTSRAFSDSFRFIRLAAPYLAPEGRIVLMKGPASLKELGDIARIELDGKFYRVGSRKLYLPFSRAERWLLSIGRLDEKQQ